MPQPDICIAMRGITKRFGTVLANDNISFEVRRGEIHALLGENGSGKSTLMNMLAGIYTPDNGHIEINGQPVRFHSPRESIAVGIGMIHQHFKLVDVMNAQENILAGTSGSFFMHTGNLETQLTDIASRYGLDIPLRRKIYDMSVGEKQTVEILKVLYRGASILIMDEPTAVLTPQEIQRLFVIMRRMREDGHAIVIITHKLGEVMEISDRVTVLRKGRTIGTWNTADTDPRAMTEQMVGRAVDLSIQRPETKSQEPCLEVNALTVFNSDQVKMLDNVSFQLLAGEILGVAGVAGSGQKELCEAIAGLQAAQGSIQFMGQQILGRSPRDIIGMGVSMSYIPEDRLGMGLVANMDIVDNLILKQYQYQPGLLIDRRPARAKAEELIEKLEIVTPGIHAPVRNLSGGNIQKVLLGREIDLHPKLLVTAYAVRGLDIHSSHTIYHLLNEQKQNGVAVLYIGEDLDVLLELCDRLLVLYNGQVNGIFDLRRRRVTKEQVGLLMTGTTDEQEAMI